MSSTTLVVITEVISSSIAQSDRGKAGNLVVSADRGVVKINYSLSGALSGRIGTGR